LAQGELIVIALGGNAFLRKGEIGTFEEQNGHIVETAKNLADLAQRGYRLVITHGNGPQIGQALLRHEAGKKLFNVPALPMHVCVAETQGSIGFMIQQALRSELKRRGLDKVVLTILSRVIVDENDEALKNPSKPVGPYYKQDEFERIKSDHPDYEFTEDKSRGGWRRLVPSPDPMRVALAEQESIKLLVDAGFIVVACGGGGIPVVEYGGWRSSGVEAVVDKDLASERMATFLRADKFLMLTDIDGAYLNFRKPNQTHLDEISAFEARNYLKGGEFAEGSMEPKILAGIRFVEDGGSLAVIAELSDVLKAAEGLSGTRIVAEAKEGSFHEAS
jgi:carbamate kinase